MRGKKSCKIEAATRSNTKKKRQTPRDMGIEKAMKYLKNNELVTILLINELVFLRPANLHK